MNRFLFPTLFLFLSASAYADNYYAGIGIGGDETKFQQSLTTTDIFTGIQTSNQTNSVNGKGLFAAGFVGFKRSVGPVSVAGELSANRSRLNYHGVTTNAATNESSDQEIKIQRNCMASILPGFDIRSGTTIYARLGLARGKVSYSEDYTNLTTTSSYSDSKWLRGNVYGIGLQFSWHLMTAIRLEYSRINYRHLTDTNYPPVPGQSRTIEISPTSNQIEADWVWNLP